MLAPAPDAASPLTRLVEGRLDELRAMTFQKVLLLPPRTVCDVRLGRSALEVSETVKELPSGRLLVQVEVWRRSLWRKPRRAHQAGIIFSSSGRIREVSDAELGDLAAAEIRV